MIFKRIITENDPMFNTAIGLYKISFPIHEQRENKSQIEILGHANYHFNIIYDNDCFVGIILYWETKEFIYIEHFAIDPNLRNGGYGSKVLKQLTDKEKILILEIDPPIDEISIRRKGFYERIGFCENTYAHIHPPYQTNFEGHKLMVLSHPNIINQHTYNMFKNYLDDTVMNI